MEVLMQLYNPMIDHQSQRKEKEFEFTSKRLFVDICQPECDSARLEIDEPTVV